jgi:hypothetical protein
MAAATNANLAKGHDANALVKTASTDAATEVGDFRTLISKNSYGAAFGKCFAFAVQSTDKELVGAQLFQKMVHVMLVAGFYVGNRWAQNAIVNGRKVNALGMVL